MLIVSHTEGPVRKKSFCSSCIATKQQLSFPSFSGPKLCYKQVGTYHVIVRCGPPHETTLERSDLGDIKSIIDRDALKTIVEREAHEAQADLRHLGSDAKERNDLVARYPPKGRP